MALSIYKLDILPSIAKICTLSWLKSSAVTKNMAVVGDKFKAGRNEKYFVLGTDCIDLICASCCSARKSCLSAITNWTPLNFGDDVRLPLLFDQSQLLLHVL